MTLDLTQLTNTLAAPVAQMTAANNAQNPLNFASAPQPAPAMPIDAPQGPIAPVGASGGQQGLSSKPAGGVSDSFATQLGRAADQLGIPPGPGGWAKSLVGAAQSALSGLGTGGSSVGRVAPGQGWFAGATKGLQAVAQQKAEAKQQALVNARENQRAQDEHLESQTRIAHTQAQTLAEARAESRLDEEARMKSVEMGRTLAQPFTAHHEVIGKDVTEDDILASGGLKPGSKYDPMKVTAIPTGLTVKDVDGKPTYERTYTVFKKDDSPVTVGAEEANILTKYGISGPVKEGQVFPHGDLYDEQLTAAMAAKATDDKLRQDAKKAGIEDTKEDNTIQANQDKATLTPWIGSHTGRYIEVLRGAMKQTDNPKVQAAATRLYQDLKPEEIERMDHDVQDEKAKQEEIALKRQEDNLNNIGTAGGIVTDDMKAKIGALPKDKQAVLAKYPSALQGALLGVAFGPGDVEFDKIFPARLTKGAPGLNAQDAYAVIKQLNPNWNMQQYKLTGDMFKKITGGPIGVNIGQYNNVLQHMSDAQDVVSEAAGRANNPKFLNTALNALETQGWGAEAARIRTALQTPKAEFELLMSGGYKPTEADNDAYNKILDPAATPAQLGAAFKQIAHVGAVRLEQINAQYKRLSGRNIPGILNQETVDAANHLNVDPQTRKLLGSLDVGDTLFHDPDWTPPSPGEVAKQKLQDQPKTKPPVPPGAYGTAPGSDGKMHYVTKDGVILGPAE